MENNRKTLENTNGTTNQYETTTQYGMTNGTTKQDGTQSEHWNKIIETKKDKTRLEKQQMKTKTILYKVYTRKGEYHHAYSAELKGSREWAID